MHRLFLISMLTTFAISVFASDIVFVHLGKKILPCFFITMKQARYLNENSTIYLLADELAFHAFQNPSYLKHLQDDKITLINMEEIPLTEEHKIFQKVNKIDTNLFDGFWKFALQRFFYLFDFCYDKDLKNFVHLETDTMLYVDLDELIPIFKNLKVNLAAPFQSYVGCIPCFVYVNDWTCLKLLMNHIINETCKYKGHEPHIEINDMQLLASFYRDFGNNAMTPLPLLMPDFSAHYTKRKSNFSPDNNTPLEFLSLNSHLFPGYIFDAAVYGVFANGNDRRYFPSNRAGIIHYRSIFDPGKLTFYWGHDIKNRPVPYCSLLGRSYRIVNLHFHSKEPQHHASFTNNRLEFEKESHL